MTGPRQAQAQQTRAAILRAARARFAAEGYEGATIRAIAADAAIDASMVMRYYGSKQDLFAAAVDYDLDLPDLSELAGVPRDQLGATAVRHFLHRWEGDGEAAASLRVLLASAATSARAADQMREIFTAQLLPFVAAAGPPGAQQASLRAGLVATQMLGLALCRYVLHLAPVNKMDGEQVVRWVAPTVQRYLTETAA